MHSDKQSVGNRAESAKTVIIEEQLPILHIAVCDDEKEQLERLKQTFDTVAMPLSLQVEYFTSAENLLEELQIRKESEEELPEVIFCDVKMPKMDGIEFGKKLREISSALYLVLFTAYPEYAIHGYETRAFRYLLKPVTDSDITQVLHKILQEKGKCKKLLVRTAEKESVIVLSDITYLSAEDKYTILYTKGEHFVDRMSLSDYEKMLAPYGFFRIHRKYLVNLTQHKNMGKGKVTLLDGTTLPISRRRERDYREKLLQMLEEDLML